jgi:hypothetical protein
VKRALAIATEAKDWRRVGNYIVDGEGRIIVQFAAQADDARRWKRRPADLDATVLATMILALPQLVAALDITQFALTKDRETSGKIDLEGVLAYVTPALQALGGAL